MVVIRLLLVAIASCCQITFGQTHHSKVDNLAANFPASAYPGINLASFPIYDPSRSETQFSSKVQSISGSSTVYALKDGVYRDIDIVVSNGAVLRARNLGNVIFSGNVRVKVESGGVLDGITFTNAYPIGTGMVEVRDGRVTRCSFLNLVSPQSESSSKRCIYGRGGAQLIDHNSFQNICLSSLTIIVHASGPSITYRNRFITQCVDFTAEIWRVGGSSISNTYAPAFVDENYFEDQNGEHELMSIKASGVHVRGNTIVNSQGAITNRYGSGNTIINNHITCRSTSSGAIRSFGRNQVISNNYVTGCGNGYGIALGLGSNCYGYQGNCQYEAGLQATLVGNVLEGGSALVVGDNGKGDICPTYSTVMNNQWSSAQPRTDNGCTIPSSNPMTSLHTRPIRPSALTPADTGPFVRQSQYADACSSVPCGRGGACTNSNGGSSHSCDCYAGYRNSGSTCVDIDECANNPCGVGGVCTNSEASYSCACATGYKLNAEQTGCEVDSTQCESNTCGNGVCQPQATGYTCVCNSGYTPSANGRVCERIDNCRGNTCGNGQCVNGLTTYTCNCNTGYTPSANGLVCENVDDCIGHTCGVGACQDGINSYTCTCPSGYEPSADKRSCVDIDECVRNPAICGTGATCSNAPGRYTCTCIDGYQLADGMATCVRVSACAQQPCLNNGVCRDVNSGSSFTCDCTGTGYTGTLCETSSTACASNPCLNNGVCEVDDKGLDTCKCQPGFEGTLCAENINECIHANTCVATNTKSCTDKHLGVVCHCKPGYHGDNCETYRNDCGPGIPDEDYYENPICRCPLGYSGAVCEIVPLLNSRQENACDAYPDVCSGRGNCHNVDIGSGETRPQCTCFDGYDSYDCSTATYDSCDSSPCNAGGTCRSYRTGKFDCACPQGRTGLTCQIDINECASSPCLTGRCSNRHNHFHCTCPRGWSGERCHIHG